MDKSIIREFAKLRVLTPFDFQRMDELVKDLTNALEESSSSNVVVTGAMHHHAHHHHHHQQQQQQHQKRRGGRKRRPPVKLQQQTTGQSPCVGGGCPSSSVAAAAACSPPSTSNLLLLACSEDSVSSIDIEVGIANKSNLGEEEGRQSDSDCCHFQSGSRTRPIFVVGGRSSILQTTTQQKKPSFFCPVGSFAESDSVNENFSPVRPHRRKRKFKRMAVDPSVGLGLSDLPSDTATGGRLQMQRYKLESRWSLRRGGDLMDGGHHHHHHGWSEVDALRSPILPGKRKHSARERSLELLESEMALQVAGKNLGSMVISEGSSEQNEERSTSERRFIRTNGGGGCGIDGGTMDLSEEGAASYKIVESSSSSLSSSESDAGIYTNDEGREGDDEHSDFYHEGGPSCGIPGVILPWWENGHPPLEMEEDDRQMAAEQTFQSILTGGFPHLSYEGQQHSFGSGVCQLPQMHGREIRAGRRRLRDLRPGFSIVSTMNEKISKFLQNTEQNELWLQPMKKKEMDQLGHLASLYSLNMRSEGSNDDKCPVLTKTRNTTQVVNLDKIGVNTLWSRTAVNEIKRRRRTPPTSPGNEDLTGESLDLISDHNLGLDQMLLQNVAGTWEPEQQEEGTKNPVTTAQERQKEHGLEFGHSSHQNDF